MKKKILILPAAIAVLAAAFFITAAVPAKFDEISSYAEYHSTSDEHHYNREAVRKYAETATAKENLKNGDFRYLSPANNDSATNCANFVSQCLWAGGFEMNDEWYMRKYSDSVPGFKKLTDRIYTSGQRFISGSFGIGTAPDYTDMDYFWSLTWSCAGEQLKYCEKNIFSGSYEADDLDEFYDIVIEQDIKTGDVIYQSPGNIHHVLIVSNISDDGKAYFASHNPPVFDMEINSDTWNKYGFSGGVVIYKVKD